MVASAVTDTDGAYTLDVAPGTYVVCEVLKTEAAPFVWQQSTPSGNNACTALGGDLAPAGHNVTLSNAPATVNFGNHLAAVLGCGPNDARSATIDEEGKPSATVTLPEVCSSPAQAYPFDVGVSPDEEFKQFVVFGGAPDGTVVFTEEIDWIPYGLNYLPDGNLEIPPTLVVLQPGGTPVVGVSCEAGQPNAAVPDCRQSRTASCDGAQPRSRLRRPGRRKRSLAVPG